MPSKAPSPAMDSVSDELWALVEPLLPPRRPGVHGRTGRPRLDDRAALEGILFVLRTGGGDLYGGSAGAILAGASIDIAAWHDENATDLTAADDLAGLGLLPGRVLLPHCTAADVPRAEEWAARHGFEVLGAPESSGLVVDGDIVAVSGPGPVWLSTPGGTLTLRAGGTVPGGGTAS